MMLRKKESDNQPEFDPSEVIKMEKFTLYTRELAAYLGQFPTDIHNGYETIVTTQEYTHWLKNTGIIRGNLAITFLCVASYKGKSNNAYVKATIENVFPRSNEQNQWLPKMLPYNSQIRDEDMGIKVRFWRDDLIFSLNTYKERFQNVLEEITYPTKHSYFERFWDNRKEYNLFWNLFLCAIDDDIYNEQLPNVVELAHYLDFDEPMMRDWCRAVEYVLAGNKLSEDCGLECETVEGARFFLHKKE